MSQPAAGQHTPGPSFAKALMALREKAGRVQPLREDHDVESVVAVLDLCGAISAVLPYLAPFSEVAAARNAAPDLLAALQALEYASTDEGEHTIGMAWARARAAIQKATQHPAETAERQERP